MLLVEDSMTREVVTLSPEATAKEALALCRERRIRHLPVVEDGKLVGIVSDRDLRSATPAFGDPARAAALEEVRVSSVMARDVLTARPEDPIEAAANRMREARVGCLPVVEGEDLVGIVTASDVMGALVQLLGAHGPGSRLEVAMPDRPGALAEVGGILGELGINIVSVAFGPRLEAGDGPADAAVRGLDDGFPARRVAVFRVGTIRPGGAVEALERAGYAVISPPGP